MPRCSVCDDGAALLCGACVDAALAASRARLAQARRAEADWRARAEAAPARPPEVDADAGAAGLAKTLLAVAKRVHADRAELRTARAANDATRRRVAAARRRLARRRAELDALRSAIQAPSARASLRATPRWATVAALFEAFPIVEISPRPRRRSLRGVATICGLPLPSDARACREQLPPEVWRCALAAVARVVATAADELGVALPHPLGVGRSALARVADGDAAAASRYALTPAAPDFETALDLLRNDVTRLCVEGGVAPGDLGPAECMLPNLLALRAVARRRAAGAPPAARPHASSPQSDDAAVPEEPSSPRERAASSAEEDWHMVGDDPFATLAEADRQYSSPV